MPAAAALNRVAAWRPALRRTVWFGSNADNAYVYGHRRSVVQRLFPMPTEGEPFLRRHGAPDPADPRVDPASVEALRNAVRALTKWSGGPRFVNKRITNNRRIAFLAEAFPEARFLEVLHDGQAVAFSLANVDWWERDPVWWYGGTAGDWRAEGKDPWELCARHWVCEVEAVADGLAHVPSDRTLRVRYEDLVVDPLGTLEGIAGFSGIPITPGYREELAGLRFPDERERWRDELSAEVITTIERTQRERLLALGYLI